MSDLKPFLIGLAVCFAWATLVTISGVMYASIARWNQYAKAHPEEYSFRSAIKVAKWQDWAAMVTGPMTFAWALHLLNAWCSGIPIDRPPFGFVKFCGGMGVICIAFGIAQAMAARRRPHREWRFNGWALAVAMLLLGAVMFVIAVWPPDSPG